MNTTLKTIYRGYRNIHLVSDSDRAVQNCNNALGHFSNHKISQLKTSRHLASQIPPDLLIIDLDSIGSDRADYVLFMTQCFLPNVPVIIMGNISKTEEQRYRASFVLEVITGTDTSGTSASLVTN